MQFKVPDWAHDIGTMSFWVMLIIMASSAFSAVTITSSAPYSNCNVGYCEPVPITITQTGAPLSEQVYLTLDFTNATGKMLWAKNYVFKGKNKFELDAPFDLPNGNKNFLIEYGALGTGKFNISVIGANSGTLYALLDPWFNNSWNYRQAIAVNNTLGSNQTNFQVKLTFNSSDLIAANKMNISGADIRFTDSDGSTALYHWVETGLNTTATDVWVKIPTLNNDANHTIYMYYGNPAAVTTADPWNVFLFYDNFQNATAWTNDSGTWNISAGQLKLVSGTNVVIHATGISCENCSIRTNMYVPSSATNTYAGLTALYGTAYNATQAHIWYRTLSNQWEYFQNSSAVANTSLSPEGGSAKLQWKLSFSQNISRVYSNGTKIFDLIVPAALTSRNVGFQTYSALAGWYFGDFYSLSKFQATDPTSFFLSEEVLDLTSPNVVNVLPANNYYAAYNASNASTYLLNFTYNASDQALSYCEFYVNASYKQNDTSPTNNTNKNILNVNITANVNTSWFVSCVDNSSNRGNSTAFYFYVNTTNYTIVPASNGSITDSYWLTTPPSTAACVSATTLRQYWILGATNYTKDTICAYNCTANSVLGSICASPPEMSWVNLLLILGGVILGIMILLAGLLR